MVIGITGSSGSGKSTICELLEVKYDVTVFNADIIARQLSQKGTEYYNDIVNEFGKEILTTNEEIDRLKLAKIIYDSDEEREKLNKCTFKHITKEMKELIEARKEKHKRIVKSINNDINYEDIQDPLIAIDAPLLFEAELQNICDVVIAVISQNRELQVERIVNRDKITKQEAIKRLDAQKPNSFYIENSNYVIINDDDFEETEKQVEKIYYSMQKEIKGK